MDENMTFNKALRELRHAVAEAMGFYRLIDWILETVTRLAIWARRKLEEQE